jgi:hypothetical protein
MTHNLRSYIDINDVDVNISVTVIKILSPERHGCRQADNDNKTVLFPLPSVYFRFIPFLSDFFHLFPILSVSLFTATLLRRPMLQFGIENSTV